MTTDENSCFQCQAIIWRTLTVPGYTARTGWG